MITGAMVPVLDKGYVRFVDVLGSDLSVTNAARASYAKESEEFCDADEKLLKYLLKHKHLSPLRHAMMTFEIKAPLMVARQVWKYVVGSDHTMENSWNEMSRRYVTMEPEFYMPEWRGKPANSKQGSGDALDPSHELYKMACFEMEDSILDGVKKYEWAMTAGVAPEQARCFLPAYAMYTVWRWTASLQGVLHFLDQRLEHDAQWEIQQYAIAIKQLAQPHFPATFNCYELLKDTND